MAMRKTKEIEIPKVKKLNYPLLVLGLVIVVLVVLLGWKNKGLFIVAMVNGRPITRLELESRMVDRYGQSSLEELVNERIVRDAAAKKGVKVIAPEIDVKEQEIRKRLGDQVNLEQALAQQKITLADFRKQMELQVVVEKLVADQIIITDAEVAEYISKNKIVLTATDEAQMKEETRSILFQQKVNEAFGKLFSDLKSQTPVLKFL
ncbi:MAG: hypothetical protein AAB506_01180 [Patescibacteria group bacterium]